MMSARAFRWKLVGAFAAVYLIWGSTYLAIRFALETLPPFTIAGLRFLTAGAILYGWARLRGSPPPINRHWPAAFLTGALLLLVGNGGVVWAERSIPSGLTSLLIATEPLWIVILDWLFVGHRRPTPAVVAGLILGFAGTAILLEPFSGIATGKTDWRGAAIVLFASLSWAAGSLCSIRAERPANPLLATGMQLISGGILLVVAGLMTGEWRSLDFSATSLKSWLAVAYLLVFGSLIGFTAYLWLLRSTTPTRACTYAYVNPVVAVFLGWCLAGEAITYRIILATPVIITAVVLITQRQSDFGRTPSTSVQLPESRESPLVKDTFCISK